MKYKLLLFALFSFTFFLYGQTEKKGSVYCSQKKMNSGAVLTEELNVAPHSFDVLDYKLNLNLYNNFISPYPKTFTGSVIVTLKADSSINSISLNAVNTSLGIDSVRMAGASFTHSGNIVNIVLDRTYAAGETLSVKIYYNHKNVSDGAFNVSNGFVFTDCEPEGAREWFPCWDKPSDKATVDITVKTPATVKLGSNGRLEDSTKIQDTIYYNWISRDPVATYLVVITGKVNYNLDVFYWHKISNPNDSIPMRFYYNSNENPAPMKSALLEMTTYFSTIFTEHPFEKNGFATLNNQFIWGGMENQTLTSICPGCWDENLISHEFAHQWFGDMITCATWADVGLNEGWATYCEALWYEHTDGYSQYKSAINSDASYYMSSNPGWPIYNPDWAINTPDLNTLFNTAITYDKGGCVLHMLRYVLGDSVFFAGVKAYANSEYKFHSATLADFYNLMSQATGQDLNWFYNEWYTQANHPKYSNNYFISQQGSNTWRAGFVAKQTQTNAGFFKMPLEIKISFTSGSDTTIRVMNDVNNQVFYWDFNRQPSTVAFDPNSNIVLKQATLTQIQDPTPVELVSFTASAKENGVNLSWRTATEKNNRGFEVERKTAGQDNWATVGYVPGNGTTTIEHSYSYLDKVSGGKFIYRLKQYDYDGTYTYSDEAAVNAVPASFVLHQNYPNPFNPNTIIKFELPEASKIKLSVYNILGEEIKVLREGNFEAGTYDVVFNGANLPSGIYIYKLQSNNRELTAKMILAK